MTTEELARQLAEAVFPEAPDIKVPEGSGYSGALMTRSMNKHKKKCREDAVQEAIEAMLPLLRPHIERLEKLEAEAESRRAKEAAIAAEVEESLERLVDNAGDWINGYDYSFDGTKFMSAVRAELTTLLAAERAKWEGVVKECRGVINDCHQG